MTTTIPALDFYLAGVATACLLACTFAARQYIVRRLGRAKPLPDIHPDRDEATLCCADEGGVPVVMDGVVVGDRYGNWWQQTDDGWVVIPPPARMQGNSAAREWPLPRRAAE